ncbi:MAG TPA: ferric reductase-like transmembrane domain-containing protein [Gaiellaceae bacterium]
MLAATTGPSAYWYLTRGTGVVALLLLTSGVVLGVLTSTRWASPRWPRFVVSGLHRNVTLLAVVFVVVHVVTTILDGYAPVRLWDAVIPFASRYRPVWVGFGALAFDLLLALIATSLLRARLGFRAWRIVHWFAYASWPVALVHALGTGSDARTGWFGLVALASVGLVALAVAVRLYEAPPGALGLRLAGGAAVLVVPLGIGIWASGGPLAAGWARKAGTPSRLLASAPVVTKIVKVRVSAGGLPATPFSAPIQGNVSETGPGSDGLVTVGLNATAAGGAKGLLQVTLRGLPLQNGGVQMTGSSVSFGPRGSPQAYSGQIVSLEGSRIEATVQNSAGASLDLTADVQIDTSNRTLSGSLHVA